MRRLAAPTLLALALAALGCTEKNPDYCPDAGDKYRKSCAVARDAGLFADAKAEAHAAGDTPEAGDAAEAGDAKGDASDAPAEKPPICAVDGDCAADGGTNLACDKSGAEPKCVECVESKHCTNMNKPACDTKSRRCVECVGVGTECKFDSGRTACDAMAQKCVECVDDSKCGDALPICELATNKCRKCAADAECKTGPGICVDADGHCAKATEVVTLGGTGCTPSGLLYCKASLASAALSPTTPILLVKGPDPVGEIDPPAGIATKVLIVGKEHAVVGAGSGDSAGVHLGGSTEYWVRDLTISGGTVGIVAESVKLAHINRCVVTMNGKGGIKTIDSGFDITNTIVAGNMAGTDTGGVSFGGVRLGDVPAGGVGRFENNTVVDNKLIGVVCKVPTYDTSTNILHNNLGGDSVNCTGTLCCGAADPDPLLDPSYHLKVGSPCIDKLTWTAASVSLDIQGQLRQTAPGKLDCGADEYVP